MGIRKIINSLPLRRKLLRNFLLHLRSNNPGSCIGFRSNVTKTATNLRVMRNEKLDMKGTANKHIAANIFTIPRKANFRDEVCIKSVPKAGPDVKQANVMPAARLLHSSEIAW
jgi:hypothetical protein